MKKVVVGMSGGVDSSVAAYLLKKEGYQVYGLSLLMLDDNKSKKAIEDAKKAAEIIKIKHYILDIRKEFEENVIKYFVDSYLKGLTPNPCPRCNKNIKFRYLMNEAKKIGSKVATGHYINLIKDKERILLSGAKHKNSQEYFLSLIDKEILENIIFPLSNYTKDEVIKIAKSIGLDFIAEKSSSQDICFIDVDHLHFIKRYASPKDIEGYIKHENGKILGRHSGYFKYTVGQRKGLGIGYEYPLYVIKIIPEKNEVIVGPKESLIKNILKVNILNEFYPIEKEKDYEVKIRYKTPPIKAKVISKDNNTIILEGVFTAPAIGQLAVLYENKGIIGGGDIIE
ncbi:MAG TPA: tRNA 2-thiouridine(34) synthase MnmA [Spirochaetota bacterium]|nr:tRNA 2-thiouridine(34) synthase MnmA [Spirochaetota bacterium]HOM38925.1 tRNA 2-thiouridine(34) synthase MnmA [Spirochaetota bacterium]HPQ49181.1 tRNA 2-thiouridine(34) synthase MnmA [Spirochaetota bacterium]